MDQDDLSLIIHRAITADVETEKERLRLVIGNMTRHDLGRLAFFDPRSDRYAMLECVGADPNTGNHFLYSTFVDSLLCQTRLKIDHLVAFAVTPPFPMDGKELPTGIVMGLATDLISNPNVFLQWWDLYRRVKAPPARQGFWKRLFGRK